MRTLIPGLLVVILALAAAPASAGKIGFVEVEKALYTVDEGKARLGELEAWAAPRQEQLESLRARVADLQQQITQQRPVATPEAVKRLEDEEIAARRGYEDAGRQFQRDLDAKQTEVLREVARRINTVVTDYAEANGYDAIFILKDRTLIYLADEADLTDVIVREYNTRFPLESQ